MTLPPEDQLTLFSEPELMPDYPEDLKALASRIPSHVRFGTSSWTFEGWRGEVYRRTYGSQKRFVQQSLAEYASYPLFGTVGIDSTYYRPANQEVLASYNAMLPAAFPCVMKVWEELSTWVFPEHPKQGASSGQRNPHFLDPEIFRRVVQGPVSQSFHDHLGCYLVAVPPFRGYVDNEAFEAAVARFLESAPAGYEYAFELREPRLMTDSYFTILRELGGSHVFNFWARMPSLREQLAACGGTPIGSRVVVRLLLPPGRSYSALKGEWAPFDKIVEPQLGMRRDVADLCRIAGSEGQQVLVIVNNKAEGCSPATIRALAELVQER